VQILNKLLLSEYFSYFSTVHVFRAMTNTLTPDVKKQSAK